MSVICCDPVSCPIPLTHSLHPLNHHWCLVSYTTRSPTPFRNICGPQIIINKEISFFYLPDNLCCFAVIQLRAESWRNTQSPRSPSSASLRSSSVSRFITLREEKPLIQPALPDCHLHMDLCCFCNIRPLTSECLALSHHLCAWSLCVFRTRAAGWWGDYLLCAGGSGRPRPLTNGSVRGGERSPTSRIFQ